jgi:hypothetical protein
MGMSNFFLTPSTFEECSSASQNDWEKHYVIPFYSKHFAQSHILIFLLFDLIHVPGVRVLQLDEPYFAGPASYLGRNISVSISSPFLESPVNLCIQDLHYRVVWA